MFGLNRVPDKSSDGAVLKRFVTRKPMSIFIQIKNFKDDEEKEKLNHLLETLKNKLPDCFKLGAAVAERDCFFDAVAQGLNELKNKGLIRSSRTFNVKFLRKKCKSFARRARQSVKGTWCENFSEEEEVKLCEHIPSIVLKREDIEKASSDSEMKFLKSGNAVWERFKLEGKNICQKYDVKIRIIDLRDVEIDRKYVTKRKIGRGNNTIYIVHYKSHFVPLLSNIEKDIKRIIKVPKEEVYGNAIGSNSGNISQSCTSIPFQERKEMDHSAYGSHLNNVVQSHSCISVQGTGDSSHDQSIDPKRSSQVGLDQSTCQFKEYIPHHWIGLMYQLDLSVLFLLRKLKHEHKYSSLSITFESSDIVKFSDIVLRFEEKTICVHIENVSKYYIDCSIRYAKLFTKDKEKQIFFMTDFFDSFVRQQFDSSLSSIEYLIIYTNVGLSLTEEKKFMKDRSWNFYPFTFDIIKAEECDVLNDFLFTNDNKERCVAYRFVQDEKTREEFLKRLEVSPATQKLIIEQKLSEKEMIEAFLEKLIFAVNQPSREELNSLIKSEIRNLNETHDDYIVLQERALGDLKDSEKYKKLGNVRRTIYEFNLLMIFLHDMFFNRNVFSINFKGKGCDMSIVINYRGRSTCVKAYNVDTSIGYAQLFPSRKKTDLFCINRQFAFFIEELKTNVRYFVVYTNANLNLTKDKKLKKNSSKCFYPFQFEKMNFGRKKYKFFRHFSSIMNEDGFYQFSKEETQKLLNSLRLPYSLQREKKQGKLSDEYEKELKEKFLNKFILAIDQMDQDRLNVTIKKEIDEINKMPYNYKELHEIALRWSESHELGPITKETMKNLLADIKCNKLNCAEIQNKNIDEEIRFARCVIGKQKTRSFNRFLHFLIKGGGVKYLAILKEEGINPRNLSNILQKARNNAMEAFEDLFNLWFDAEGNKTQYLKNLETAGVNLSNVSSILAGAGYNGASAFENLHNLWFDTKRNKTQYLTTLEAERVNLCNMSSILGGAGHHGADAFKDLYDLWFDTKGNKTHYLKTLEVEGVNLPSMSSILHRSGKYAANVFKDLYDLWFDAEGNKTQYLKSIEDEGLNLTNVSSILNTARNNAAKAFKNLFDLWFDAEGNKTRYLKFLEDEGIHLANVSSILSGSGKNAARAFKDLYDLWFDVKGNKTQYLKTLQAEGVTLVNLSSILHRAGRLAAKAFRDLYELWFDTKGNKTQYLKILEREGISLTNMSSILGGAGNYAADAFKDLYDLWFDSKGNKTQYLKTLEDEGVNLTNMSSILGGAGNSAAKAFIDLYDLWFDAKGNKTKYLKTLEDEGVNLANVSSILHKAGNKSMKAFKDLYDLWFDAKGNKTQYLRTLEDEGIRLPNMSSILNGSGANAKKSFKDLYNICFDINGKKTQSLKTLEAEGVNLPLISSILRRAGASTTKAFKDLYNLWFDTKGQKTHYLKTLEDAGIDLPIVSCILSEAGGNAGKAFAELYYIWFDEYGNKTPYLKHFNEEKDRKLNFTLRNLSSVLNGAGVNAMVAFDKLHSVCFDNEGERTQVLNDFFEAGFKPRHLSCVLCATGTRAHSSLKNMHDLCFDNDGEKSKLLDDFFKAGFTPSDLCSTLSSASESLKTFHDFCFEGETRKYLGHFLSEQGQFTTSDLSEILNGAKANVCSALEGLHHVCFDESGNKTILLNSLYKIGFSASDLSNIMSSTGSNAPSILKKFHKFCRRKSYLDHFLAEKELFTPKSVSRILYRAGVNICTDFKRLHSLCFDKLGKRTSYLNCLIENNDSQTISAILRSEMGP